MTDHRAHPEVAAVETVGGVLTDLVDLAETLPVPPGQAEATARILDRLSEELAETAGMLRGASAAFPAWRTASAARPRLDGSVPAEDERIAAARALLAEQHQPIVMTPGDVRHLLAHFQRRVVELLEVIDGTSPDARDSGSGPS